MASDSDTEELFGSFNFLLEISGINESASGVVAGFTGISGGGVKIEKRDVTTGNSPRREYEQGPVEFDNIALTRGLTTNMDLLDWVQSAIEGKDDVKRDGAIMLLDNDKAEVRRWEFFGAFPVAWAGAELSSDGSAVTIEKFEIAVAEVRWS
jgi:phage tail-like protein